MPEYATEAEQMLADAVEALRRLNRAVWLDFPEWAITKAETATASEVVAAYEVWRSAATVPSLSREERTRRATGVPNIDMLTDDEYEALYHRPRATTDPGNSAESSDA